MTVSNGWTCSSCGAWVSYNQFHTCRWPAPPAQAPIQQLPYIRTYPKCAGCSVSIVGGAEHTVTHKTASGSTEVHYCRTCCPHCKQPPA